MKNLFLLGTAVLFTISFAGCSDDDVPAFENEEEVIDKVTLTFTPTTGETLVFESIDPDGEGPSDFQVPVVTIARNKTYTLTIQVENTITMENISDEIAEEADEHMFFFEWTERVFTAPDGDGNVDNRSDVVNYKDSDSMGLPLGLVTEWNTIDVITDGFFRIVLKHQPDIKADNTTVLDGETDIDMTWSLLISE